MLTGTAVALFLGFHFIISFGRGLDSILLSSGVSERQECVFECLDLIVRALECFHGLTLSRPISCYPGENETAGKNGYNNSSLHLTIRVFI